MSLVAMDPQALATGLLHLPNELLLEIFEDLSDDTLYQLAVICRRLHFLALPLVFKHHELNPTSGRCALYREEMRALPALRMSLSVTSLISIRCCFNAPTLINESYELYRLISRLTSIKDVKLHLPVLDIRTNGIEIDLRIWSQIFLWLLDAVIQKSCSKLTVTGETGGNHEFPAVIPRSAGANPRLYQVLEGKRESFKLYNNSQMLNRPYLNRSLICTYTQSIFASERPGSSSVPSINKMSKVVDGKLLQSSSVSNVEDSECTNAIDSPVHSLTSFNVYSAMLLDYPFTDWTINILNTAPITSLSLEEVDIPTETWAYILPLLILPALSELTIRSSTMVFVDLCHFFARHPSITTLELKGCTMPFQRSPVSQDILPKLTALAASSQYLTCLLEDKDNFPNLVSITIASHLYRLQSFDYHLTERALTSIAQRIQETAVTLKLTSQPEVEQWLVETVRGGPGANVLRSLHCVTKLRISTVLSFTFSKSAVALFPRWLALFPALKQVAFVNFCIELEHDATITFVRAISDACPRLKIVRIGYEDYATTA